MLTLQEIGDLTEEQMDAMSKEDLLKIRTKIALHALAVNCRFAEVALDSDRLSRDHMITLVAAHNVTKEIMTKAFPDRKW